MHFDQILAPVLPLWPERVPLADHRTPLPDPEAHDASNPGHLFPELTRIWGDIEDEVGSDDPWRELMVWTLYQVFHAAAIDVATDGDSELETRAIPPEAIAERYEENLQEDGWTRLLPAYVEPMG